MADRVFSRTLSIRTLMTDSHSDMDYLRNLDAQAVSLVYNHYFPEVFRYVRYRLGDEVLSEDIASEVFFRLLKAVKARRGPERNLRGWLIATAHHMVTDHLRRKYRHPVEAISDLLSSDGKGPLEEVEQRDASSALRRALLHLTRDQQHVLALRFGQGYSLEETAVLMDKKVNAVKALQFRALTALQHKMDAIE
jgi:RNA polymerase sigma-70 factor (ECF subfamily)